MPVYSLSTLHSCDLRLKWKSVSLTRAHCPPDTLVKGSPYNPFHPMDPLQLQLHCLHCLFLHPDKLSGEVKVRAGYYRSKKKNERNCDCCPESKYCLWQPAFNVGKHQHMSTWSYTKKITFVIEAIAVHLEFQPLYPATRAEIYWSLSQDVSLWFMAALPSTEGKTQPWWANVSKTALADYYTKRQANLTKVNWRHRGDY